MRLELIAFALGITSALAGCAADAFDPDSHVTIDTGTYGLALHLTGNHMPTIGGTPSGATEPASGREVRIHALVTAPGDATEIKSPSTYGRYVVNTPVIAHTPVDAHGFYQVALEPGTYSVFISDGDAWFCNLHSTIGACAVQVASGGTTRFDIAVDYEASY